MTVQGSRIIEQSIAAEAMLPDLVVKMIGETVIRELALGNTVTISSIQDEITFEVKKK